MVFSSSTFIFCFLPVCFLIYYCLNNRVKNGWLLFMSLLFYAWGGIAFLPVICFSILLNYFSGWLIGKGDLDGHSNLRKITFVCSICLNLLFLGYWKYLTFFVDTINHMLNINLQMQDITLPIGISFFTFQGLSYVIDVYRRDVPVQKKIINVGLYIALFPQLIAGPIVRYSDINTELQSRRHPPELVVEGIRRFTIGLAKKAILANTLAVNADAVFSRPYLENTPGVAWIGILSYTLQIYFDFSGYSDMAIGLGRMFGFHFLENFNYPYISKSVADFWRRWHMSLGKWLKDYLYIPLGGNRRGKGRTIINKLIVFLACGLWHGANWTFVLWGAYYGVLTLLSLLFQKPVEKFNAKHVFTESRWFQLIRILRTDFFVMLGWVLFKADNISYAIGYLKSMFGLNTVTQAGYTWRWYLTNYDVFIIVVALIAMLPAGKKVAELLENKINSGSGELLKNALTIALLMVSIMYVVTSTYNPFIYFQF